MSSNQIIVIGRVENDLKKAVTHLPDSGQKVVKVTLTVDRPAKDGMGNPITDRIECKFWNRQADVLIEHVKQGDLLSVVGVLRIDTWEVDGEKRRRYYINGDTFQMLSLAQSKAG